MRAAPSPGLPCRKVNYAVTPFMTRIRHIVFISEMGFDGAEWKNVSEERDGRERRGGDDEDGKQTVRALGD